MRTNEERTSAACRPALHPRPAPRLLRLAAAAAVLAPLARAQDPVRVPAQLGAEVRARLADPAQQNRVNERLAEGRLARLLEDLRLRFTLFEDARDDGAALGFTYDFAKSLFVSADEHPHTLDLVARGNVAFEPEANPDDLLETVLRLRWSGTRALARPAEARTLQAASLPDPSAEQLLAFDRDAFAALASRFAQETSAAAVRDDPEFQALARRYHQELARRLPPELIWDADLHAALESDQEFSSRQVVLGAALSGRLVSFDPEARLSRWNVFDFPAAALRWLAGRDEDFRASGEAYPTVVTGLDVVDAARDEGRGALTDDASFLRARLEASLASPVFEHQGETLFLRAGWRLDQELDAPAAVRRAGTDGHSHLELALDLPRGWSLSYATGRLPLDGQDDSTFALGFRVQL